MKKNLLILFIAVLAAFSSQAQIIVSGEITANTTWTNNNIYLLDGWVYVRDGATLTIEPGTLIKGDFATKGALIIERGARIIADGTAEQPIVFTSQNAPGVNPETQVPYRNYGDWGGLIICGRASINVPENAGNGTVAGENIIEGGVGSIYGGGANPDDNDDSGILRYVRIEYCGIAFQPNSEINGLTLGGVGRGTIIENVQVSYSGDDAFEFFGGTVNCKNLIAYRTWDDDFDTDFGYTGNVQFAVSMRDPAIADQSGSNGFESDNDGQGTGNTPITHPKFSNVTIIGPLANNTTINSNYKRALHIRRNSKCSVFNSVFAGYPTGLLVDGTASQTNATNNELRFMNSVLAAMTDTLATNSNANPNNISGAFDISMWFESMSNGNTTYNAVSDLMIQDYSVNSPKFTLMNGSPLASGASFSDSYLMDSFFTPVSFRGAFGSEDWTACWAEWDPMNEAYNGATNNVITAEIEAEGNIVVCPGGSVVLHALTNDANAMIDWNTGETSEEIEVMAPATINLTITNANGCSAYAETLEIGVFEEPSVAIQANGPTSFCTGSSVELVSNQTTGNTWSTDATGSSIVVDESGVYSVTYEDENGCVAQSNTIEVSVSDAPAPSVSTGGSTTLCDGETVTLTASVSDTYQWYLNGQMMNGETSQTIEAGEAGAYYVNVTNSEQCDGVGNSSNVFVVVNPQPVADFDFDAANGSFEYEFNNNSINATSYAWNFGDGETSTEANPTHTFTSAGSHTVTLTANNGDCTDSYSFTIANVAIEENAINHLIALYPNPSQGDAILNIRLNGARNVQIRLSDVSGKTVWTNNVFNAEGDQFITLPADQISSGVYFVDVNIDATRQVIKWVVNK